MPPQQRFRINQLWPIVAAQGLSVSSLNPATAPSPAERPPPQSTHQHLDHAQGIRPVQQAQQVRPVILGLG